MGRPPSVQQRTHDFAAEQRNRAARQAQADKQRDAMARAERAQERKRQEAATVKKAHEALARRAPSEPAVARALEADSHRASNHLLARLKSRNALRELFVLREIIDQPVALREAGPTLR
jgi:hypothetical protein